MSKLHTGKMIVPTLVARFRCIGPNCPDTCCTGWRVDVDKESYDSLITCKDPVFGPILKTHLVLQSKGSLRHYARLEMDKTTKHCALLSQERTCTMHASLGEEALADVCYGYPRVTHQIGSENWQSMYLSCPETARLALSDNDAYAFVETTSKTREELAFGLNSRGDISLQTMADLRLLAIQVLSEESISIVDRMVALGWLARQIDIDIQKSELNVDALIREVTQLLESGACKKILDNLGATPALSANVFALLFANPATREYSDRQKAFTERIAASMLLGREIDTTHVTASYIRGLGLFDTEPGVLDRVLGRNVLNEVLVECFPWGKSNALTHYRRLLTRFGVLRFMLAATAAAENKVPEFTTLIDAVYISQRLYQHSETFATEAERILVGAECDDLNSLFLLLK